MDSTDDLVKLKLRPNNVKPSLVLKELLKKSKIGIGVPPTPPLVAVDLAKQTAVPPIPPLRRIVTGNDANGKSRVVIDGPPAKVIESEGGGLFELWNSDSEPLDTQQTHDRADIDIKLSPDAGCTKFRFFQVNPTPEGVSNEALEAAAAKAFALMNAEHHRVNTSRHPAMHVTHTVDYVVMLKGSATMILDTEEVEVRPFDVVVQRGTNHAWKNTGTDPALFVAVLIDKELKMAEA